MVKNLSVILQAEITDTRNNGIMSLKYQLCRIMNMINEIVLYKPNEQFQLEVQLKDESVWLTQEQIAALFDVKRPAITKHLNNIYNSSELDEYSTCSILEHMGNDGKQRYQTKYYNLDMILAVGYRVNSHNAILFRRWAAIF